MSSNVRRTLAKFVGCPFAAGGDEGALRVAIEPPLTKVPPAPERKAHDVGKPADHGVLGVGGQAGLQAAAAVDHRRGERHVGDRRGDRRGAGDEGQVAAGDRGAPRRAARPRAAARRRPRCRCPARSARAVLPRGPPAAGRPRDRRAAPGTRPAPAAPRRRLRMSVRAST